MPRSDQAARALQAAARPPHLRSGSHPRVSSVPPPAPQVVLCSDRMRALFRTVEQVAQHDINVLISGETGTGKELVAQTLHAQSPRAAAPIVAINCATLHPNLMCATLFGHERGAFTGADHKRAGVFETAHRGTVMLDEVGELDAAAQAALLRVLETGRFTPVGATRELTVDVRLVAATHRDLAERVQRGQFRGDLYYRLNALTLEVPPLRARLEDIEPLASHFLAGVTQRHALPPRHFARDVLEALRAHRWPGNVRELRNVVERAAILASGPQIDVTDLPERLQPDAGASPQGAACDSGQRITGGLPFPTGQPGGFREAVQAYERLLIERALAATHGNRARAAERLGMPRRTLLHKLHALGLTAS